MNGRGFDAALDYLFGKGEEQWRRFLMNSGGRGSGGRAPGQGGVAPPEAEKKLNFDNAKPL